MIEEMCIGQSSGNGEWIKEKKDSMRLYDLQ